MPGVEALPQRAAARLHREVDDGRGPAEGGSSRPGLEGVLGEGAAKGKLHVRVHVDGPGNDPFATGIDGAVSGDLQVLAYERDSLTIHQDIGAGGGIRIDDGAVRDERAHGNPLWGELRSRVAAGQTREWT